MKNRAEMIHENFIARVESADLPAPLFDLTPADVGLSNSDVAELFESQVISRHLDIVSRRLRAREEAYYTIGSSGHEGNAVFGKAFRYRDMAFLHYRSAAFMVQRSRQVPGQTPVYDMLLSFAASADDPVSGGRHKVLGSKTLLVPPQTSTIASHLPKAMGAAHAIGLAKRLHNPNALMPGDALSICSFGDASANHSTALGAINTAAWTAYQRQPMPVVFICEDNGIGISVKTPPGWIRANFERRPGLHYIYCDGLNLLDTWRGATEAERYARQYRRPVFLHTRTIRLMGHAGSDVESGYRSLKEIEDIEAQDPLLHSARILIDNGILTPRETCDLYLAVEERIARVAEQVIFRPKLKSRDDVKASLIPLPSASAVPPLPDSTERNALFAKGKFARDKRLFSQPWHMARLVNLALADIMLQYPSTVLCGEDVGKKGGVYGVTAGLQQKFGRARVTDTLLDEQSILGLALGLAQNGFLPIPEIQFLAYVHNAEDQIRGEAATLPFFSNGQFANPMVIRIAGLAYQKGFGGHFHNDNSLAVFRDIPGVVIACPSNGKDAVQMLRTCVALAYQQQRVVIFIEPIALYMTRDLYKEGDGKWMSVYEPPGTGEMVFGEPGVSGTGNDLCIITYGNGHYLSFQAAQVLREKHSIHCTVMDLRWLAPLNEAAIIKVANTCDRILIVDECRRTGSQSEALVTLFHEHGNKKPLARITADDSFIPLAEAANLMLPSVDEIVNRALVLMQAS